jgi:hypothetical protein
MVGHEALVSLIRCVLVLGALAVISTASAQPTDLFVCVESQGDAPVCQDVGAGLIHSSVCPSRLFGQFIGAFAWYPLRYVGPIEVRVETESSIFVRYPLYIEIVPLDGVDPTRVCANAPGYVLATIFPRQTTRPDPCDFWESTGIVDLSPLLTTGSTYALRFYSFMHPFVDGPGIDCVRLTSNPTANVAARDWGRVKCLYR